jgi:hypothetical protein
MRQTLNWWPFRPATTEARSDRWQRSGSRSKHNRQQVCASAIWYRLARYHGYVKHQADGPRSCSGLTRRSWFRIRTCLLITLVVTLPIRLLRVDRRSCSTRTSTALPNAARRGTRIAQVNAQPNAQRGGQRKTTRNGTSIVELNNRPSMPLRIAANSPARIWPDTTPGT